MAEFLDRVRAQSSTPGIPVRVIGFDPDIHDCGWAVVCAEVHPVNPPRVTSVDIVSLRAPATRKHVPAVDQSCAMADTIAHRWLTGARTGELMYVVLESQQFYPNPNDDRPRMVSVANALIRVAHVTGAIQGIARARSVETRIRAFLPATWKGQRTKSVTVREAAKALTARGVGDVQAFALGSKDETVHRVPVAGLEALPPAWEHALDGLGLSLYGLRLIEGGRWDIA